MIDRTMTDADPAAASIGAGGRLDTETLSLVRLAGIISAGTEVQVRDALTRAVADCRTSWVEEVVLQSYLFAGFPRALNAAREWRRISGQPAPASDEGENYEQVEQWRVQGETTCSTVYGPFYERLRHNIRGLHPALDAWMIVDGYGKVLSRPALDLRRRELCVVAACASAGQDRQLHSHLHGALHAGATPSDVRDALDSIADVVGSENSARYQQLLERVLGPR